MKRHFTLFALLLPATIFLSGCDQISATLGVETPAQKEARGDAEGRAVGSACRHSGRAIEDCYAIYAWLPKASIYAGWREMDEYMRENKLDTIAPQLPPPQAPTTGKKKKKSASNGENPSESTPEAIPAPAPNAAANAPARSEPAPSPSTPETPGKAVSS
ncbi:hypothetical protein [Azonexus sp.]|uniref:hypothetical protein n=1 Tax=Azonexus sp. TaxID=1872668 RepID=UPI0039E2608E